MRAPDFIKWLIVAVIITTFIMTHEAMANEHNCPTYTPEQDKLLHMAYAIGSQYDEELFEVMDGHIGHSTAAVLVYEAFVEDHVIKFNTRDGTMGSWGVMHVQLSTAFWMDGIPNTYANRDKLAPAMITMFLNDDFKAITYGYRYLKQQVIATRSFYLGRYRYNGTGEAAIAYADATQEIVNDFIRCGYFD